MSSGIIIPIAIGLVLGIAFLMLFALMFESIVPIQSIHIPPIPRAHEHLNVVVTIPKDASSPGGNFELAGYGVFAFTDPSIALSI